MTKLSRKKDLMFNIQTWVMRSSTEFVSGKSHLTMSKTMEVDSSGISLRGKKKRRAVVLERWNVQWLTSNEMRDRGLKLKDKKTPTCDRHMTSSLTVLDVMLN